MAKGEPQREKMGPETKKLTSNTVERSGEPLRGAYQTKSKSVHRNPKISSLKPAERKGC